MSHDETTRVPGRGLGAALFGGLRGKGADETLDIPTAVMLPLVAAMLADGRVEDDELAEIHSICAASPIFERNSRFENEYLIGHAIKLIEDLGVADACKRARAMLSANLRETAFVHAVRVIFSDGHVGGLEREVIERMTEWLEIDSERARMMVEVVSIMRHPVGA